MLQTNISRIEMYIRIAALFYIIYIFATVWEMAAIEVLDPLVSAPLIAVVLYKLISFVLVYAFLNRWREFLTSRSPCEFMLKFYINTLRKRFLIKVD